MKSLNQFFPMFKRLERILINNVEWCPNCEKEVEINKDFTCPECYNRLLPCSQCDMDKVNCNKCIYDK